MYVYFQHGHILQVLCYLISVFNPDNLKNIKYLILSRILGKFYSDDSNHNNNNNSYYLSRAFSMPDCII